jgi:hypothetical protein
MVTSRSAKNSCWLRGFQFLLNGIQFDVSRGGIQRHLLAGILERQSCGLHAGSRRMYVLFGEG